MNDPFAVCRGDRLDQPHGDVEKGVDAHAALRHDLVQRPSLDELHGEEVGAVVLLDGIDGDDVGMVERRDGLGLALESLPALEVVRELGAQNLEGYLSAEPRVVRRVHLAHRAGAQSSDDLVTAKVFAHHGDFHDTLSGRDAAGAAPLVGQ